MLSTVYSLLTLLLPILAADLLDQLPPGVGQDYDGMMEALSDIQDNGDNMMAGIWWQKEILQKLESSLQEAERRMTAVESKNNVLESVRDSLKAEVEQLEGKKSELLSKMTEEEVEVAKTRVELQPLKSSLATAKTELGRLTLEVTNKQNELEDIKAELLSNKSSVSVSTTPIPILVALVISLVFNFMVGLGLARHLRTGEDAEEVALYGKDWIKKVLALSAKRVKRKQTKRPQGAENVNTEAIQNINKNKDQEIPWSSDFFDKFISSDFTLDWVPSHTNPLQNAANF